MEAEARQVAAEGPRRSLDQEAWPQLLRLQEPCERGRQAQADPALCRDRCGRARQPGAGWAVGRGQHRQVLRGWMAYYAVPMSGSAISAFRHHMIERWHGALMRRSQRRRLTWMRMKKIADRH